MLVVEPTASRFEGEGVARGGVEEHLLERISALENHLSRLTDKVLQLAELSLRQSSTNYLDQTLLQSLIAVLSEAGVLDRRQLDAAWRAIRESERAEKEAKARREELCERIVAAGEASGDHAWPFPLHRRYRRFIDSAFADMKNSSVRRQGSPVLAAKFLEEFAGEGPWAHVDMAGPGFLERSRGDYLTQRGGTGYGVRLIVELAQRLSG